MATSPNSGKRRKVSLANVINLRDTIRGAKSPVMVGPTEVLWSTRTPDGLGTLSLEKQTDDVIDAEAWGPGADWLLDQAPRLLGDHDDLTGFQPTGKIGDLWRRHPFLLARTDRPWDALVGAIFGQKVQIANAVKARRSLARRFGDPAPGPSKGWILPAPETVARMGYADFHRSGVERKRAEILIRTAREMPRLTSTFAASGPDAAAKMQARLQHIRGIGPWTTAMVTAVTLGDPDAVPVGDYHLPNTISWLLAGEPRGTDERMLELLEPYAGHRWRVLRLAKSTGGAPKFGPKLSLTDDGLHRGR
ncbi:MAG: DNA-3-methyladenine glycosylase family protein [Acidimicrobiales bacterium]